MTGRTRAGVAASAVGPDAVRLQYTPWRVSCARCGVKVRAGAVADGSSVFTAAVEELAAYLAQVTDPTTVSRLLGIPPDEHVALSAGSASSCRVPAGRRVRRRRSHGTVGGSRVYKEAIRGRQNGNPGSKGEPNTMATAADAEIVMRLYDLRREETLRKARHFMGFAFNPKNLDELRAVSRDMTAADNVLWRQALSFWEMAASLVLRGAVDADLFLDSNGEGILIYAKFHHFHAETEKESGNIFMKNTAELIQKYPAAKALYDMFLPMFGPKS